MVMGIKWTPWQVSMQRRIEVLSAFTFVSIIIFSELATVILLALFLRYGGLLASALFAAYLVFFYFDRNAGDYHTRGQGFEFLRGWRMWRHCSSYFPSQLIKTVDLPANKNYIFAVFPHGVISCGAFGHFVTSGTNFRQLFPGIRSKLCTLSFHFYVPVFREVVLGWGMMKASSSSIKRALNRSTDKNAAYNQDGYTSNGVVLMVGGAQEALNARPGVYKLVLKKRKGFVKAAIQTGASLVPVFSFNEVEVFDQPNNEPGTAIRTFQETFKKFTGFIPPFFIGRGFFQYTYGIIPRRHPIQTVVGAPIEMVKNESPSNEEIDKMHAKFIVELEKLFEDHKAKYVKNANKIKLQFE